MNIRPAWRAMAAVAERAALVGGAVIRSSDPRRAGTEKSAGDYITDADRRSETAIAALLVQEAPGIPVVGEEGGGATADRYWVVDPLDGTTNLLHGFPIVGVSVALVEEGRPVAGAVHAPFLRETYSASRGGGAFARPGTGSPHPLRISDRDPHRAVVATGFPFRHKDLLPTYEPVLHRALERFEDVRRPGAAALDLAWVAAGVFDGFFELRLSAWDVAAGALLVEEAGGRVTDWEAGPGYLSGDILAGSPGVHEALLEVSAGER
jgi:myo-inositol-1(or 4)-monophosphatase